MVVGFALACLVQFYRVIIQGGDEAINGGYRNRGIHTEFDRR